MCGYMIGAYFFSLELVLLEIVQFSGIPFTLCTLYVYNSRGR